MAGSAPAARVMRLRAEIGVLPLLSGCASPGVRGWFVELQGYVASMDGAAVVGASVTLSDLEGKLLAELDTGPDGGWSLVMLVHEPLGNHLKMEVSADDYSPGLAWYDINLEAGDPSLLVAGPGQTFNTLFRRLTTLRLAEAADRAQAVGVVVDGLTGVPVPGLDLAVQRGWNAPIGEPAVSSALTGPDGAFSFEVDEPGVYTVSVNEFAGYAYSRFPAWATLDGRRSVGVVLPPTEAGELRAAVVWDGQIQDVDLHLGAYRPDGWHTSEGNRFHLWAGEPTLLSGGEVHAEITRSAADGRGPESLAVYQQPSRSPIQLTVVDNDHLEESAPGGLAAATVQVQVWYGEDIPRYYVVSPDMVGTWWRPVSLSVTAVSYVVEEWGAGIDPAEDGAF